MNETKKEILEFKKEFLEAHKERVVDVLGNSNYQKLIRDRAYYPPELLYEEAKDIISFIDERETESKLYDLAIVSLLAIKDSKLKDEKKLVRKK